MHWRKTEDAVTKQAVTPKPKRVKEKSVKLTYKQKQELEALPGKIETLELQIEVLHEKMAEASFYKQPPQIITDTNAELAKLDAELKSAYDLWETLAALE